MTLRLLLSSNKHTYAPTMTNPDDVKDKFYNDLDERLFLQQPVHTTRTHKPILGDLNARAGTDHQVPRL